MHGAKLVAAIVKTLAWSPNGQSLLGAHDGGRTYVCDRELHVGRELPRHDAPFGLRAAAWSDDGHAIHTVDDYTIRRWDTSTGKQLSSVPHHVRAWFPPRFEFSPDRARLAATGPACRIVDTASGEQEAAVIPLLDGKAVVVSADGHYLASAPKAIDQLVYVVQTAAGQELLSSKQFAEKYGWRNDPSKVKLP